MCGIIFAHGKNLDVRSLVLSQYEAQKTRGREGFGMIRFSDNGAEVERSLEEGPILDHVIAKPTGGIMFHHRYPTSTKNTLASTHPFIVQANGRTFAVVHNGVIHNTPELSAYHKNLNIAYHSADDTGRFNDSEALAYDVARTITGLQKKPKSKGSAAVLAMELVNNKPRFLWYFRNSGNPLFVIRNRGLFMASSEGSGVQTPENRLNRLDLLTGKVSEHGKIKLKTWSYYQTPAKTKTKGKNDGYAPDFLQAYNHPERWDSKSKIGFRGGEIYSRLEDDDMPADDEPENRTDSTMKRINAELGNIDAELERLYGESKTVEEYEDAEEAILQAEQDRLTAQLMSAYADGDWETAKRIEGEALAMGFELE